LQTMFPVPRLTEAFVDEVVRRIGGRRFTNLYAPPPGMLNPDYLFRGFLAEAKILEEEGLEKPTRQAKLAKLLEESEQDLTQEDFYESATLELKRQIEDIFLEPIQTAVKKAAKQFKGVKSQPSFEHFSTILIAVNSGYSSLPPDLFETLVSRSCKKDTSQIDLSVCLSVHHHQGDFDSYIFLTKKVLHIRNDASWDMANQFLSAADACFGESMTSMMRDQLNPELWGKHLPPIEDIMFRGDGVNYIRKAPLVPDSRLS
jgi:hypothetical protein